MNLKKNGKLSSVTEKLISIYIPESTTKRTPSIVTDVSAMLVEMMHFLTPGGEMSNTCIKDHNDQTVSNIKNNHRRVVFFSS